jgi:hypothetical protein
MRSPPEESRRYSSAGETLEPLKSSPYRFHFVGIEHLSHPESCLSDNNTGICLSIAFHANFIDRHSRAFVDVEQNVDRITFAT